MKQLLTLIIFLFSSSIVFAQQACVPGTLTSPNKGYIIPDSATNFAHGCAGKYYEQIVYIKAPKDTTFTYNSIPVNANVDSFVIDAMIVNIPTGLNTQTVPATRPASGGIPKTNFERLVIPGDSLACVKISGNLPASLSPGPINLIINGRAYVTIPPPINLAIDTPFVLNYYNITIDAPNTGACMPAGVEEFTSLENISIAPNPSTGSSILSFYTSKNENITITIANVFGQIVYEEKINAVVGNFRKELEMKSFPNGTYYLKLANKESQVNYKILLTH